MIALALRQYAAVEMSVESTKQDDHRVTELLLGWSAGDDASRERLMGLVYDELRRIAGAQLRRERRDHTLQATALVNEAYLRLVDQTRVQWRNRAHFFGIAAQLMRRILVDHARRQRAAKRGGGATLLAINEEIAAGPERDFDLVVLDDALEQLQAFDPRAAQLVELRFFGGLTIEETGEVMQLSPATIKREWNTARAWLHREIAAEDSE